MSLNLAFTSGMVFNVHSSLVSHVKKKHLAFYVCMFELICHKDKCLWNYLMYNLVVYNSVFV